MTACLRFDEAERGFVWSVGRRYVGDDQAADDIAQEAMLLAYRHRNAFRGESHPRTWLFRIATTTAISYLRRRDRQLARVSYLDPAVLARIPARTAAPSPEETTATHELDALVEQGLGEIDDKYATVLRLRAQEVADQEIAQQLGLTVTAVKVRAHRGRAMMRRLIDPHAVRA